MKTRGEEFMDCLGNGKTEHELDLEDCDLDLDWDECEIKPADEHEFYNKVKKGGIKKWKNKKLMKNQ